MSKNLTRKGLALGALVALGSTVIAGTPATAAPTALYLESAFGTNLNGVLGQNFVLSGTAVGASSSDNIKYYVEGVTAANLTVTDRFTTNLSAAAADTYGNAGIIDTDAAAKTATLDPIWVPGNAYEFALKLNSTNITETTSVTVTPFVDSVITNDVPGPNELKGSPITIVFNKASGLTATPTLTTVKMGSSVKATVAVSTINLEQFRGTAKGAPAAQDFVNVDFSENGGAFGFQTLYPAYDTTDKVFTVSSGMSTPTAGRVYGATAQFGTTDSASAALVTAGAGEVATLDAFAVTKGTSYLAAGDKVRSGAGSVSISTTATVVSGKSKSGQKVTFKIAESNISTLSSGASVTAGGVTLTNADSVTQEDKTVDVMTDADGKATLAISYTGIKAADAFVVSATAAGALGSVAVESNKTFTGQDSVATAVVDLSAAQAGTSVRQVPKGSAMSIEYTLVDQFGQTPSGDFQAVISEDSSYANFTANVPFASGKATFSGTDNSTANNNYRVFADVFKKNTTSGNWDAIGDGLGITSAIQIAAVGTPASITATANATTGVARAEASYVSGNTDIEQGSVTRTAPAGGTYVSGTVVGSTGALVDGATVVVTSANLLFKAGHTYGAGSITVRTDADGSYGNIYVYSNKAGTQTVTITSGGVSKTVDIKFAAVTSGGTTWKTDAPATILPGKTLRVTATLTDKYGNVVDTGSDTVKVSFTGPGFVTATTATETDSNGQVSITVLLGAGDSGPAAIKFTYAGADTITSATDTDDVVATATVAVGAPAVAARLAASTKKFYVGLDNAKGEKVVVKVAGKTVKSFTASSAMQTVVIKTTKGKKSVKVYVAGDLVVAKTLTIK